MSKVKLYTEEHLKIFYHLGKIDGFIGRQDDVDELIKNYPPIEPPSHYEIWEEAIKEQPNQRRYDFMRGADWMRDKIQGGNNEQH